MEIPKCDVCGEVWLPDKYLKESGKNVTNPARENPRLGKRCSKCKTPRWNESERPDRKKRNSQHSTNSGSGTEGKERARSLATIPNGTGLEQLYGLLAKEFKELGGGESFLKAERNWGPDAWERYEAEEQRPKERGK